MAAFYKFVLMSYSSKYQNEIQIVLWSCQSVMLFITALTYKSVCKTYSIVSDSHDKNKDTVAVFVNFFYNHFDDLGAVHDIIWSYGLSSEFKNKFIVKFLQSYHQTCKRYFFWKYFATGHWKGVVDGIGGKAKTLAHAKVMSKGDNRIIVQSSNDFLKAAEHPLTKQE